MEFKMYRPGTRYKAKSRWHNWFAWHPVRVSPTKGAWLTTVQRKGEWKLIGPCECGWEYEYRENQ